MAIKYLCYIQILWRKINCACLHFAWTFQSTGAVLWLAVILFGSVWLLAYISAGRLYTEAQKELVDHLELGPFPLIIHNS